MTIVKSLALAALVGSALAGHATLPIRAGDGLAPAAVMGALKAKTFDMGDKRALAFYQDLGQACKVTVLVADRLDDAGDIPSASVRFDTMVAAGTSARVGTANGPDLSVTCAAQAASLKIETHDRVAYTMPMTK